MSYHAGHKWTDFDFPKLGWKASRLYGWILPGRQHQFVLFIDYCLRHPITNPEFNQYELVPAELIFENVIGLKINLDMDSYSELDIVNIERINNRPSPNGKITLWDYTVSLSREGSISFTSTGFTQTTLSEPVITDNFDLDRETEFLRQLREKGPKKL